MRSLQLYQNQLFNGFICRTLYYLGVSRPTARKIIEGLLASGELMRIGKTRAVRYCLSSKNS